MLCRQHVAKGAAATGLTGSGKASRRLSGFLVCDGGATADMEEGRLTCEASNARSDIVAIMFVSESVSCAAEGFAQTIRPGPTPPPKLSHELIIRVVGAILAAWPGPAFRVIDGAMGISPDAKQQPARYRCGERPSGAFGNL
jgi:hypothetical protein